jgi:hypothetical protein
MHCALKTETYLLTVQFLQFKLQTSNIDSKQKQTALIFSTLYSYSERQMYRSTSFNGEREQKKRVAAGWVGDKISRCIDTHTETEDKSEKKKAGYNKKKTSYYLPIE